MNQVEWYLRRALASATHRTVCLGVIVAGLMPASALAQVNSQSLDRGEYASGIMTDVGGDLSLRTGNVELLEVYANGAIRWQTLREARHENELPWLHQRLRMDVLSGYGREAGESIINEQYAHLRWTAMWHRHIGTELFVQAQRNEFQALNLRWLAGGGLRSDVIHTDAFALWYGTGVFSEYENIEIPGENERENALRWNNFMVARVQFGRTEELAVVLQNTIYVQPNLADMNDFRVLEEVETDIPITRVVSLVTKFSARIDAEPPEGVKTTDLRLSQGISVSF
jgi:hypothetical protein